MENFVSNNQLFRDRLKSLMKGKSVRKLALDIRVSHTTLNNYLSGKTNPNPAIIQLLADYFGVSPLYLAGLNDIKDNLILK